MLAAAQSNKPSTSRLISVAKLGRLFRTDLPITNGFQGRIQKFEKFNEEIDLRLEQLAARPPLNLSYGEDVDDRLPEIAGLRVALARTFGIIDASLKNSASEQLRKCFRSFDLLLYIVRQWQSVGAAFSLTRR
jgi:hypothetical protein